MIQEGFVSVYSAPNETTANIVKSALDAAGILAMVLPHHTSWLDGALVPAEGSWGEVVVPKEHEEKAALILAEYITSDQADDMETDL